MEYLNEKTDFSKLAKFGKIIKFAINPREEYIDYSYGYDKYSEMTEVYNIEKLNDKSIYFLGEKYTNSDFKRNCTLIYYNHITSTKNLDNEIKNKLIFYLSLTEIKYKRHHLKLFKNIQSLEKPFKIYINSLSYDERVDLFIRTKSKVFLNVTLTSEEKGILEKELKEVYKI